MPLLNVTVKKARFVGVQAQQFNSYVTLKLQNVKSTTVTVKGSTPCWEQDFLFETNDINTGLLVEVWSKGMLWDRALGYHYIPLPEVSYTNKDDCGQWMSLDSELEMRGGEVVGTKLPTGHTLLLACRFEQPFDPENTRGIDLQRKLEMLNSTMDQEARAEQARRQILYNIGHSGYSEDSDYTSDLNYPIGGQGANSSASQFRTAANQLATPQRSLETSRENSYERDDHHQISSMTVGGRLMVGNYGYGVRNHSPRYDDVYPTTEISSHHRSPPSLQSGESSEPLFYNSRPRHYHEESSRRRKHTWNYDDSQDGWYSEGYDYQQTGLEDTRMYSDNEFHSNYTTTLKNKKQVTTYRRPSLERQATLYDEIYFGTDTCMNDPSIQDLNAVYRDCKINIKDGNYYDNIQSYTCQDERNGQDDDEDRQWDSGGQYYIHPSIPDENKRNRKTLPQRPASTIGIHRADYRPTVIRQRSYESEELDQSGGDYRWQKNQQLHHRPMSYEDSSGGGGGGTGKKLPPTPLKPSNVLLGGRKPFSLPATPGRQLPQTFISSSDESYYRRNYNEDYNYAYQSSQERLQDNYVATVYQNVAETHNGKMHIHNEFLPEYIPEMTDHYSQEYMDSHDTCDDETQLAIDNRYKNDCQETSIHPAATVPPTSGQSIYHDAYQQNTYPKSVKTIHQYGNLQNSEVTDNYADAYYNENSVNSYEEHLYESEAFQNIGENSFQQSSFGDSYGQDSSLILYKDDSLSESYPDLYTDRDNYQNKHKKDNNQVLSYDSAVCTTNVHENNIPSSIHNQLHTEQEYDNNYSVPTSSSIYHQQSHTENHDQAVQPTTTQESYENSRNDPQSNFINYHHQDQYNRENTSVECKNDYDQNYTNYANSYDEPYQDESYEQSCVESFNDNINIRQQSEVPPPEVSVTTPKGQTKTNEYQSSASEYYYSLSTVDDHQENTLANSSKRKRPYIQRDTSTLLQQNTDSLESKDDELKDSFETAVSSVNSSQQQKQQLQQYRKGFPGDYSIAGDSSPVAATSIIDSPGSAVVSAVQPTIATTIFNHITSNVSVTTTAMVHSNVTTTTTTAIANKKSLTRVESYDEGNYQDIEEDDEYLETASNNLQRKDSELSHRSQSSQQSSNQSQKPKLTRGDSYVSDSYDDSYSNRDKRNDDFDDAFNKSTLDRSNSYQKHDLSRGSSAYGKNLTKPQAISRAESYQRGYFKDQGSIDETEIVLSNAINGEYKMRDETLERYERGEEALTRGSRENSLVEPYKVTPPLSRSSSPRGSITKQTSLDESVQMDTPPRSPPEPPADEELLEMVGSAPIPTQLKERPDMTSKQRWHWAYNKIIMQLNVSNIFALYYN